MGLLHQFGLFHRPVVVVVAVVAVTSDEVLLLVEEKTTAAEDDAVAPLLTVTSAVIGTPGSGSSHMTSFSSHSPLPGATE